MSVVRPEMLVESGRKLFRKIRRGRSIHCFCLGAAKTGTTSFASMFESCYRAAHEPETASVTEAVAKILGNCPPSRGDEKPQYVQNSPGNLDVPAWLRERDRRLNLEVEASHPLGYMAPWLPDIFPEARFVITIRDPLSWLKSRLNFHYYKTPPEWQKYRDLIWGRWHNGYHDEEKILADLGLYSVDAYLSQYAEQYSLLLRYLPQDRTLIVKTEELDSARDRLAEFLSVNPATITRRHANAFSHEESIIDRLPEAFVGQRVDEYCKWMKDLP